MCLKEDDFRTPSQAFSERFLSGNLDTFVMNNSNLLLTSPICPSHTVHFWHQIPSGTLSSHYPFTRKTSKILIQKIGLVPSLQILSSLTTSFLKLAKEIAQSLRRVSVYKGKMISGHRTTLLHPGSVTLFFSCTALLY